MSESERVEVLILGSGFGDELLACCLAQSGRRTAVVLKSSAISSRTYRLASVHKSRWKLQCWMPILAQSTRRSR
jgi:hypothetical protein